MVFWLGGACLIAWVLLKVISSRKEKSVLEADESTPAFNNLDKTCEAIFSDLRVPQTSREIDILSFYYKTKVDSIKPCEKGWQATPYMNPIFRIFADSENLYLANLEEKYAIPLSSIRAIKSVNKTIRIEEWNKDEEFNKGAYKQYKLSEDNYGGIICKGYHILEFEYADELWGIYFPRYELPIIEEITGIKAETL